METVSILFKDDKKDIDPDIMMSPNNILLESIRGICFCCFNNKKDLKSIFSTFYSKDKLETYFDVITNCLAAEMLMDENIPKLYYKICEECMRKVKDAFYLKCLINSTQQQLRSKIDNLKRLEFNIKFENNESADNILNDEEINYNYDTPPFDNQLDGEKINKKCRKKSTINHKLKKVDKSCIYSKRNKMTSSEKLENKKSKEKPLYILEKDALNCFKCDETFPLHSALVKHMPIHFPNYICDVCAKVFASKTKLLKHIALHQAKEYKCDICGKSYRGIDNLRSHVQRHSKFSFYKCLHCPQRFQTYHSRLKHLIQIHHEEPKKYQCKQCPKIYFQGNALTRHVKRVHLQERPYPCTVCGDGFFTRTELSEHMRRHTGVKNFKCTVCLKSYGRKYTLNEHMKIHNNDKRFVCPYCGRAFTQKCTLKVHLKTHEKTALQNQ